MKEEFLLEKIDAERIKEAIKINAFSEHPWIPIYSKDDDSIKLYGITTHFIKLSTMLQKSSHDIIRNNKDIKFDLHFADEDIYLIFNNKKDAISFIKKYKLKFNSEDVEKMVKIHEKQIELLKKFMEAFIEDI